MRLPVLVGVLGLAGCGVIYTSPDVYQSGAIPGFSSRADADVQVIPLTFETAMAANLDEYVPARLPDAFRPAPGRTPPPVSPGDTRMPDLPEPEAGALRDRLGEAAELPPAATALERPEGPLAVDLPPPAEPQPYRIGVADVLLLSANTAGATLEDVPSLITAQSARQGYIVQDDGAIAIPDVGRVQVAGRTLEEAEAEIFQALVEQRLDPSFSLEIAEFNSQRVSVGGAVRQPVLQPITLKPLYLSEAIQIAGGVATENLDHAVVRLFRNGQAYQAPMRSIFGADQLNDVLLRDGDSVFVDTSYDLSQARAYFEEQLRLRQAQLAEREFEFRRRQAEIDEVRFGLTLAQYELQKVQLRQQLAQLRLSTSDFELARNADRRAAAAEERQAFRDRVELGAVHRDYAYLAGEVRRPMRMPLPFESRASMADILFEDGGGLNINFADYAAIYLIRRDISPEGGGAVTAYHLDASNAANLSTASLIELRPDDVIFVAEQPVTAWGRTITQLTPQLLSQSAAVANIAN
jgi:polysaccharide export outer membrane protein